MKTNSNLYKKFCQESLLYEAWRIVKSKNSAGGIDGVTIADFDKDCHTYIAEIANELKAGKWMPQPYKGITVPKKKNEKRELGLLSVKDKIVQTAIKILIEPKLEPVFIGNSYGYRPGKGHNKAIRRTLFECQNRNKNWVVKLDIDNFFDTVAHDILIAKLRQVIKDEEIVRLVMLCVKMGRVNKRMKWQDIKAGVPQGAVLSPLLSNLYLDAFDKFVVTLPCAYVRYADDFVIICETREQADGILEGASNYLKNELRLVLNTPLVTELTEGFDFLGINVSKQGAGLSEQKKNEIKEKIGRFGFTAEGFVANSVNVWRSIGIYYGSLLSQELLAEIDGFLKERCKALIIKNHKLIPNSAVLKRILGEMEYLSDDFRKNTKTIILELAELYDRQKTEVKEQSLNKQNKKVITKRKREYQKREGENRELVVNTYGSFVGLTQKGITVRQQGKIIYQKPVGALAHITITGKGVALSSNLIDYCLANKISIDFFSPSGVHTGSILSNRYIESTLWNRQACCGSEKRMLLAQMIIMAKLKNQFNLVKYFHKYHKNANRQLAAEYEQLSKFYDSFDKFLKTKGKGVKDESFVSQLVAYEAQGAVKYWSYIRELLSDDEIKFERRERKGAKDIVNCMLNYGYAILYSRVWQALLKARLNPFDSIIHVRQAGKPTFVYDVIEIFRAQAVDRIIISLVQKGINLSVENGLLNEETKKLLAKNVLDRLSRYENYRGEEITMEQIINCQTKEIASYIVEESKSYKPYIAKW